MRGKINRTFGIGLFGAIGFAVVGVLVNNWISEAPNRAAAAVLTAARDDRADEMAAYLDSPRIEASLKSEIDAAILWRKANPERPGPLQLIFGTMLTVMLLPEVLSVPGHPDNAQTVKDTAKAAKALLVPERPDPMLDIPAVAHGLAQASAFAKFVPAALGYAQGKLPGPDADMSDFVRFRIKQRDENTTIVTLSPDGIDYFVRSKETKLIFERRGYLRWVVTGIDLPDDGGPLFQPAPADQAAKPAATPPQ
jgi:hypothetical protein